MCVDVRDRPSVFPDAFKHLCDNFPYSISLAMIMNIYKGALGCGNVEDLPKEPEVPLIRRKRENISFGPSGAKRAKTSTPLSGPLEKDEASEKAYVPSSQNPFPCKYNPSKTTFPYFQGTYDNSSLHP